MTEFVFNIVRKIICILRDAGIMCTPKLTANVPIKICDTLSDTFSGQFPCFSDVTFFIIFSAIVILMVLLVIKGIVCLWKTLFDYENRQDKSDEKHQIHQCNEQERKDSASEKVDSCKRDAEFYMRVRLKHYAQGYLKVMDDAMKGMGAILKQEIEKSKAKESDNKKKAEEYSIFLKEYNVGVFYVFYLCEDMACFGIGTCSYHEKLYESYNILCTIYEKIVRIDTEEIVRIDIIEKIKESNNFKDINEKQKKEILDIIAGLDSTRNFDIAVKNFEKAKNLFNAIKKELDSIN